MSEFALYLRLGFRHIADLRGYDHILFVTALTAAYAPAEWRRLAWLVTAFTVGHSVTLALATLDLVRLPGPVVEALIPLTIVATSVYAIALATRGATTRAPMAPRYALAAGFGLIHGLGFSNFLRALLGAEESLFRPLLAFNLGLEVGQLCIVATVLALGVLAGRWLALPRRDWILVISGATAGPALVLLGERLPALARP